MTVESPSKNWGGSRKGAGRKRKSDRAHVPHGHRPAVEPNLPVHVMVRLIAGLFDLRSAATFAALSAAFAKGGVRPGFQVINFSAHGNDLHMIVEAENEQSLTGGMKGLNVRMARALNKLMGRTGKVFADRYHARILRSPAQVKNALEYVQLDRDTSKK